MSLFNSVPQISKETRLEQRLVKETWNRIQEDVYEESQEYELEIQKKQTDN